MKKTLFAIVVLAAVGIAFAVPVLAIQANSGTVQVRMLEVRKAMIDDQIAYLNGELTLDQIKERRAVNRDLMQGMMDEASLTGIGMGSGMAGGIMGSDAMAGMMGSGMGSMMSGVMGSGMGDMMGSDAMAGMMNGDTADMPCHDSGA